MTVELPSAFLEWAYFVGIVAAFLVAVVVAVAVVSWLVIAGAVLLRLLHPRRDSP